MNRCLAFLLVLATGCCHCITTKGKLMNIKQEPFGLTKDGKPATLYTLRNAKGIEAKITNYGGIVISLTAPDRNGKFDDVVLGYDNLAGYLAKTPYFGCIVGRYGNRIANGKFTLDGQTYCLATNNGPNSLHGGIIGFDKVLWKARPFESADGPALELRYTSKDGEEGFPGTLKVKAVYTLTADNALRLDYTAKTDKATVLNLTQHSYFNLAGQGTGDILGHQVVINADAFTPVDSTLIPTGEIRPVKGTPFDFTTPHTIGERINQSDEQLKFGGGYDHNFVLNKAFDKQLSLVATVTEPTSGRVLEVWTTEPGLQFYCGNFLDGTITGKSGKVYKYRYAFCMEPQHYPDSPNKPLFPSVVLRAGDTYTHTMVYKLGVK